MASPIGLLGGCRGCSASSHALKSSMTALLAVEPMDGGVRLTVSGEPGEVVARLSGAGIRRLHSHAPSLEQIFLTYYDTRASQREAVASAHGRLDRLPGTEPRGELR